MTNGRHHDLLDRIFITNALEVHFPHCHNSSLPLFGSDHCPLPFQSSPSSIQTSPPFRFDLKWTTYPDFHQLMIKWWNEFPINSSLEFEFQWKVKVKHLKKKIKGWAKKDYGEKKRQKIEALVILFDLEQIKK